MSFLSGLTDTDFDLLGIRHNLYRLREHLVLLVTKKAE